MTTKKTDISRYVKRTETTSLIDKLTVPVTPQTKEKIKALKATVNVNAYLRDAIEKLLEEAS